MPLLDRLISAKNPVNARIAGVRIAVMPRFGADPAGTPAGAAECAAAGAGTSSTPRASASGSATTIARIPAAVSPKLKPPNATSAATVTGATALPRNPQNVWIEKARPSRVAGILCDSNA